MEVTECMEFMYIMGLIDGMYFKDALTIIIAFFAFVVAVYAAFVGPRFQLNLHVMEVIAAKANEVNTLWLREKNHRYNYFCHSNDSTYRKNSD